jgi:hypothetical protein
MLDANAGINGNNANSVELLNTFNLEFNATDIDTCIRFEYMVRNWLKAYAYESTKLGVKNFWLLVGLQISPVRCDFQKTIVDISPWSLCDTMNPILSGSDYCAYQSSTVDNARLIRQNTVFEVTTLETFQTYTLPNGTIVLEEFSVSASYNETESVSLT